jgi:hypothetical protein
MLIPFLEKTEPASCQAVDSDGNGDVSCDYTVVSRTSRDSPRLNVPLGDGMAWI